MSVKLLIGYDGSGFANDAIDDLQHSGLPADAEAVVLAAADVWPPVLEGEHPRHLVERQSAFAATARALAIAAMNEASTLARQGANRLRALFPRWKVTAEAFPDSPSRVLVEHADKWKPDLLVIGAHGQSGVAQFVERFICGIGSIAQKVVRFAPCSVRIGRRSAVKAIRPTRIIVGVDGSTESAAAVQAVAMRKWPAGSEAKIITVQTRRGPVAAADFLEASQCAESSRDDRSTWARQTVDRCAAELRDSGLNITPLVLEGDPKSVLIEEAQRWPADCIFVGAHGMGRMERFMLGSVSSAVAELATCSVEIVRHSGTFT